MNIIRSKHLAVLLLASMLHAALPASATAQNGTMERRTLTFSGSATASMAFGVQSLLVDPASPPTTTIQLEFGKDGFGSVNDPALGGGVTFTLTKTSAGGGALTFPITALPSGNTSISGKEITVSQNDPAATPGLFTLSIIHTASTAGAETWTLAVAGLPTPSPAIRGVASLSGASTGFTSLTPVGACGGSTPTVCPTCPTCRFDLSRIRFYYRIPDFSRPTGPPPPDCKVCGEIWGQRFDDVRFERTMAAFTPTASERVILTRDGMKLSPFKVTGGEVVGSAMEGTDGQVYQMIQYPKGKPPLVGLSMRIAPPADTTATPSAPRNSRNLLFGLGGLIIGALGGMAIGRRGNADDPRSTG